jgi:hypothetical protein
MIQIHLACLAAASLLLAPRYNAERLPYRVAWGPYTVVAEKTGPEEDASMRVRVVDTAGHVLLEIRDQQILDVALVELTGRGALELYVHTDTGALRCCSTQYYFTRDEGLRNLLIYEGMLGCITQIKDLNGDGRPELIAGIDALAYLGRLPFQNTPWLQRVLGWNGKAYEDQTRRYPAGSRRRAREYREAFLAARKKRGDEAELRRRSAAAGYYGSAWMIGEGGRALRWLLKHAPRATRRWFVRHEADVREAIRWDLRERIRVSQQKVFAEPDLADPAPITGVE